MHLLVSFCNSAPATMFYLLLFQADSQIRLGIREALGSMGYVAWGVLLTLLLMSIYSMAVTVERWLTFRAAAQQSREFAPKIAARLRDLQIADALNLTRQYRKSHLAVVMNSGLQELAVSNQEKSARQLRKARRALRRASAIKIAELQRGLSSLATIGSTAPFVGLFGTVFGIIHAFEKMNESGSPGIANVAGGIAEALYTTAFGLLVAIPAVWMFNHFTSRVHGFRVEMKNSADELLDFFISQQEQAE